MEPNQIVLMVDNKLVLNLTLTKTDSIGRYQICNI